MSFRRLRTPRAARRRRIDRALGGRSGAENGQTRGRVLDDQGATGADRPLLLAVARVDPVALGAALGVVGGLAVFMGTLVLVLKGQAPVGPTLGLLAQYFIGYTVTPVGSVVGLLYGAAAGFGVGWLAGALRNGIVSIYLRVVRVRAALTEVSRAFDP